MNFQLATARDMQNRQSLKQQESKSKGDKGDGGAGGAASDLLDNASDLHGVERVALGFHITDVVSEYRACASVLRLWHPEKEELANRVLLPILLLRLPDHLSPEQSEAHVRFVMKFQQCSGPVTAKGLEDTSVIGFEGSHSLKNVLTGKALAAEGLSVSDLLSDFPIGVFFNK